MRSLAQQVLSFPEPEPEREQFALSDQRQAGDDLTIARVRSASKHWSPYLCKGLIGVLREHLIRHHEHEAREVLAFLNSKRPGKRGFPPTEANLRLICARLADGATLAECKAVISRKWQDTQARRRDGDPVFDPRYLRPATLFRASNFSQYVGELGAGS